MMADKESIMILPGVTLLKYNQYDKTAWQKKIINDVKK